MQFKAYGIFFFYLISFAFITLGSNLRLDGYYVLGSGFGIFDIALVIISTQYLIIKGFTENLYKDKLFILLCIFVAMNVLAEFFSILVGFKSTLDFGVGKRIIFLYLFIIFFNISYKFHEIKLQILGISIGTILGGLIYYYLDYEYTIVAQSYAEIAGVQLLNDLNVIGQVFTRCFFLIYILYLITRNIFLVVGYAAFFNLALMTYSKATILVYLVIFVIFIFTVVKNSKTHLILLVVIIFSGFFYVLFDNEIIDNIQILYDKKSEQTVEGGSLDYRIDVFISGVKASLINPIFGFGGKNFRYISNIFPELRDYGLIENAENAFSEIGFTTGLINLIIFCRILFISALRSKVVLGFSLPNYEKNLILFSYSFVILIWSSVQLEIYSQLWFYAYCGAVSGIYNLLLHFNHPYQKTL